MSGYEDYHKNRNNKIYRLNTGIPSYIKEILPKDHRSGILDIGCGNGSFLYSLKMAGYVNLKGIDLDEDAVSWVTGNGINCKKIDVLNYYPEEKYDFICMNHVLEHFPKESVIPVILHIKENLLMPQGTLFIRVPNAQANTNCYWMYEDFTHNMLFTAGSLEYVLKCGGFSRVRFLDKDGTSECTANARKVKKGLVKLYEKKLDFWNWATGGAFHASSERIYTWELKAIVRNEVRQ